jgi:hypothetical protein
MSAGKGGLSPGGHREGCRCVLISLHELGMATRDLRDQMHVVVVNPEVLAVQCSAARRGNKVGG